MKEYIIAAIFLSLLLLFMASAETIGYHYYRNAAAMTSQHLLADTNAPDRTRRLCNIAHDLGADATTELQQFATTHCQRTQ